MKTTYDKTTKEWTIKASNRDLAFILDAFLFAAVSGDDDYAKEKRKELDARYRELQKAFVEMPAL